jgi:hypothetical protein
MVQRKYTSAKLRVHALSSAWEASLFETDLLNTFRLNGQLNLRRVSLFLGNGTHKNPKSCPKSMWESRNVFINGRETCGLGRAE